MRSKSLLEEEYCVILAVARKIMLVFRMFWVCRIEDYIRGYRLSGKNQNRLRRNGRCLDRGCQNTYGQCH